MTANSPCAIAVFPILMRRIRVDSVEALLFDSGDYAR